MKPLIATLLLVLAATPAGAEIYKWVDDDGVVHYSDEPHPGAETLQPGSPPVVDTRIPALPRAERDDAQSEAPASRYRRLDIVYPENDQAVRSNAGTLLIRSVLEPDLRRGDRLVPLLDGRPVEAVQTAPGEFRLDNVDRGTHTVSVQVQGADGRVWLRADPVIVHLRRISVNSPARN
jgi:hypothetical protein